MALELASGARETCTVSGNDFTLTGATTGAISFLTGITKTALTVDGSTVYAYAFESADPSTYEVMEMTYNSASNKLVRVDTVHGSNGTSAVTFDTATGAVVIYRTLTEQEFLLSHQSVSASGYLGSTFSMALSTVQQITGWTENWDTGGNFASDKFTADRAQKVDVKIQAALQVGADQDQIDLYIYKNGSAVKRGRIRASSPGPQTIAISATLDLAVNDYIDFRVKNSSNTDGVISGDDDTFFTISTHVVP